MKTLLYYHAGSNNRGCEAIVRSTIGILRRNGLASPVEVFSAHPEEDEEVSLASVATIHKGPLKAVSELNVAQRAVCKLYKKLFGTEKLYFRFTNKPFARYDFRDTVAFHVGGDHYCYAGGEDIFAMHNDAVKKGGGISVLWGCSVEPELLKKQAVVEDMKHYDLITARESLTYEALCEAGIRNAMLCPDPAFTLGYRDNAYSEALPANTVGINISTYALGEGDIGFQNYRKLIDYILTHTDMNVCLIPHVFKAHTNDRLLNQRLFDSLDDTSRVTVIDKKLSAEELKAVIRKCRIYIGARTHSTIAAYSSCVPTLVLGYSIKAKGIAKDLFGTYENYVLPVQALQNEDDLTKAFGWMLEHEQDIRAHLTDVMPAYIDSAYEAGRRALSLAK